ncbi:gliding motility-associated C-terminal domain-containing protein [Runella zeae]|uniref:gliding motility-associated C-terminal domain-containing protein n=1 Tax=Runella zeae TaxID=94255 RepID=UPI0009FE84D6|nr:gliding motility-associated C-terminal domain-containing protein [Runella zeae]
MSRRFLLMGVYWAFYFILSAKAAAKISHETTVVCNTNISKPITFVSKVGQPQKRLQATICYDSTVQLNATSFLANSTFQWTLDDVLIPNAKDSILIVKNNQIGNYKCLVSTPLYCPEMVVTPGIELALFPKPNISISEGNLTGNPCQGGTVKLSAAVSGDGAFFYQWLFENRPVLSATSNTLEAVETGNYSLKITDPNGCAYLSSSSIVITNTPPKADLKAARAGFCKGGKVTLNATHGRTYIYQWYLNGQPISGVKDSLIATQPGVYKVKVTAPNNCTTESEEVRVIQYEEPVVEIEASGKELCPGASLLLKAKGKDLKAFVWLLNGQAIEGQTQAQVVATQAGKYTVAIRDTNRCTTVSSVFEVSMVDKVVVQMDSIPPFCSEILRPVKLKGSPEGGIFLGKGVVDGVFDPIKAGKGMHTIVYVLNGSVECLNGKAEQTVAVVAPAKVELGEKRSLVRGAKLKIDVNLGEGYIYEWTPSAGIENPTSLSPIFSPETTTMYHLKAIGPVGCLAEDSIMIEVLGPLYIPDVFTPNRDGQNDMWILKGLDQYPEIEVMVLNRWGEVVFFGKGDTQLPFDGTFQDKPLSDGVYSYVIKTPSHQYEWRGKVWLMR